MIFSYIYLAVLLFSIQILAANDTAKVPVSFVKSLTDLPPTLSKFSRPEVICKKNKCTLHEANFNHVNFNRGQVETFDKSLIEISIVSPDELATLFEEVKNQPDIPFNYPKEGCWARADQVVLWLQNKGITAGKIYAEGALRFATEKIIYGWAFHVAPIVLVNQNGVIHTTVIDPALFAHPTSVSEWIEKMISYPDPKVSLKSVRYANRYNWGIPVDNSLQDYRTGHLEKSLEFAAKFLVIQNTK